MVDIWARRCIGSIFHAVHKYILLFVHESERLSKDVSMPSENLKTMTPNIDLLYVFCLHAKYVYTNDFMAEKY